MATQTVDFRELMKDVLVQKEDMETHLQTALDAARNKEDLIKLANTVKKMEKLLEEIRLDIEQRLNVIGGNKTAVIVPVATLGPVSAVPSQKVTGNHSPTANGNSVTLLTTLSGSASLNQSSVATPTQDESKPAGLGSKVSPHTYLAFYKFRKNPNIPDTHRVFLPQLSPVTTEESLYKHFCTLGYKVVDLKIFVSTNNKGNSNPGAIGFSSTDQVKEILRLKFFQIDGFHTTVREYFSKEEPYYQQNYRAVVNQGRFQVFCGGIPTRATLNDVKTVLGQFGRIRDIRLPTVKGNYGAVIHRGFAYVDFENAQDAQNLCDRQIIMIMQKEVECKPNTKPLGAIMSEPSYSSFASGGSMNDLSAALPKIPPLPPVHQFGFPVSVKDNGKSQGDYGKASGDHGKIGSGDGAGKEINCIICKVKPQNCALLWCGHTETCMECGKQLRNCPKPGCGEIVENRADVTGGLTV